MIEVNQVSNLNEIQNSTIRSRAERAQSRRTLEFIAKCDGLESAFLSFEDWSDKSLGFIYEIYVLPEFRNQNLGGALLQKAEKSRLILGAQSYSLMCIPLIELLIRVPFFLGTRTKVTLGLVKTQSVWKKH